MHEALSDRHAAPHAEGATGDLEARSGLFALVFIEVHAAGDPSHCLMGEAPRDDGADALVFLHIEAEDFVEDIVGG